MTSQALEAALSEPDNDASQLRLHELIAAQHFSGRTLPAVAEKYLRAFCDIALSSTRRRWIGIALAGMLDASPDVAHHLGQLRQEMQGLGAIILNTAEREETKIIAGIVMRQALEQGIEYNKVWVSDKVKNSAPNFPRASHPRWMAEFQSFLDTLGDLALANPNPDPSIIYPISLVASDGFRWRESNDGLPVALIQAGMLTVIAPDALLREIQFVDIPISHVQSMRSRRSSLHDSQAQVTGHEPWDLVLVLKAEPWSYRLDTSKHTGTEVTFLFQHSADAKEWERSIEEHQRERGHKDSTALLPTPAHPLMSSSSPIDLRASPPPKTDEVVHQNGRKCTKQAYSSHNSNSSQLNVCSSDPLNSSRPQPLLQPPQTEQQHRARLSRVPVEATQVHAGQQQGKMMPIVKQNQSRAAQNQHKVQSAQDSNTSSSEDVPDGVISTGQTEPLRLTPKRTTYSKGKLPRVSEAAKLKASKQLHPQSDVFDLPNGELEQEEVRKTANSKGASSSRPTSQKKSRRSKVTTHKTTGNVRGRQLQAKRKADDDDDFVPEGERPKMNTNSRRKPASVVVHGDKQPRKKARVEPSEDTRVATSGTKPPNAKTVVRHLAPLASNGTTKASKPRATKPKSPEKLASSVASSRYSLIGGLLGSQKPWKPSTAPFKKPGLPVRTAQAPSTPTAPRTQPIHSQVRPQTPTHTQKRPNDELLPPMFSSPSLGNAMEGRKERVQQVAADTEILSSNSKPIPASPNAESTAISGHADLDEVDIEKSIGDIRMAKSDPFRQRREGKKMTSFIRRLTGEDLPDKNSAPKEDLSHIMPVEIAIYDCSDFDNVLLNTASQPFPQHVPWRRKMSSPIELKKSARKNLARVPESQKPATKAKQNELVDYTEQACQPQQVNESQASQSPKRTAATKTQSKVSLAQGHSAGTRGIMEIAPSEAAILRAEETKDVEMEDSVMTAPRQPIDNTEVDHVVQAYDGEDLDGDTTLVNYDDDEQPVLDPKASLVHFRSSPPIPGSPSSHSSTSAGPDPSSQPLLSTSEAEEMEWEANLQPYQRAIHDLLIRTSKRVLRHIVDNETAVTDIAEIFLRDGEHLLRSLLQRHDRDYDYVFQDMENKTEGLKKELERAAKDLAKERRRVSALE